MKKIVVGGCSFSQTQGSFVDIKNISKKEWIPWTDILKEHYKDDIVLINKAKSSYGQSRIVESVLEGLLENKFEVDYVIAQFSAIGRGYSSNIDEFFKKVYEDETFHILLGSGENTSLNHKKITNRETKVENEWYKHSILQILMLKNILQNHNIPYKFFWGWEQIDEEIWFKNNDIFEEIYDDNFWLYGEHGGMSEYIIDSIGADEGIIPNDFHPTSMGHFLFFENIIIPLIQENLNIEYNRLDEIKKLVFKSIL
jgi:hypothetical protein